MFFFIILLASSLTYFYLINLIYFFMYFFIDRFPSNILPPNKKLHAKPVQCLCDFSVSSQCQLLLKIMLRVSAKHCLNNIVSENCCFVRINPWKFNSVWSSYLVEPFFHICILCIPSQLYLYIIRLNGKLCKRFGYIAFRQHNKSIYNICL